MNFMIRHVEMNLTFKKNEIMERFPSLQAFLLLLVVLNSVLLILAEEPTKIKPERHKL